MNILFFLLGSSLSGSSLKASSLNASTSTFNPTRKASNYDQKLKKKGGIRTRPYKLWVVIGNELFTSIPKANLRRSLNKSGRVKKVEFRRSMSEMQVQTVIVQAFPQLQLEKPTFMKCVDMQMVCIEDSGYPNGEGICEIASKGSLYMVERSTLLKVQCYL